MQKNTGKGIGFGIFLIIIGILWLLIKIDVVDPNFLSSLKDLWPLVLVVIGINIIFDRYLIVKIFTWLALLVALILYSNYDMDVVKSLDNVIYSEVVQEEVPGLEFGRIEIKDVGGDIRIGKSLEDVYRISFPDKYVNVEKYIEGNAAVADIESSMESSRIFLPSKNKYNYGYRILLGDSVAWDTKIDAAFLDGEFDFSGLTLKGIEINAAAGDVKIDADTFYDGATIDIDGAALNIVINVPDDTGVKVEYNGAIKNASVDSDWVKSDNVYTSPEYGSSNQNLYIKVNTAVGNLKINTEN